VSGMTLPRPESPDRPPTRRERQRVAARARILDAARALLVEQGLEGTTMRAIASRLQCTPTAIYHHFRNKDALLAELFAADSEGFGVTVEKLGETSDPLERIRQLAVAYVVFALQHKQQYQVIFGASPKHELHSGREVVRRELDRQVYDLLVVTIEEALRKGVFRAEFQDAQQLAQIVWSALHGFVALRMARAGASWIDWAEPRATIRLAIDVILRGSRRGDVG
jgi:AcrR family transcriptional regulator